MHVRRQIREAIVTALAAVTATPGRVFDSRIYPLESADLPGICVFTRDEEGVPEDRQGGFRLDRELPVVVEIYAATQTPDATLDDIAEEVEAILGAADRLGGIVRRFAGPTSIVVETAEQDSESPVTVMRLEFLYLYQTAIGAPGVAI